MEHEIREESGTAVVAFTGDVDLENSPEARKVLLDCVAGGASVLVDMSGITYIDSSGVASLVEALQAARTQGTGFALAALSDAALRVLELARLDKVFTIHASVADGLAAGEG
jgi:anti-sigma B factor antagonist